MNGLDLISSQFPNLTEAQKEQFGRLQELYNDWNSQIDVISRKDTDNFYERHVMHSLAIAKVTGFVDGTKIMEHVYDDDNHDITTNSNANGMMEIETNRTLPTKKNSSSSNIDGNDQSVDQICRYISSLRLKELHFRNIRPYLIVNNIFLLKLKYYIILL